jgi:integrase
MASDIHVEGKTAKNKIVGGAVFNGKSWQIRIKTIDADGRICYMLRKGFTTPEEANARKTEYDNEYQRKASSMGLATTAPANMSVQDYLGYYLNDVLSAYCCPSTIMVYKYTLYNYILPNWTKDIGVEVVMEDEVNQLLDVIEKKSPIYASKARELMYMAFKHAYYKEKRMHHIPKMRKCARPKPTVNVLSRDEIKRLLACAYDGGWYLEILLALFMGLRKGEILGVKFSDFDEQTHNVRISRQLSVSATYERDGCRRIDSEKIEKLPKTDSSIRVLHVPDYVWKELAKRRDKVEADKDRLGEKYRDNGYVSCTEDGRARGVSSLNQALTKLCRRNNITHVTVHGLRHCYATILLEQGYELPVISAMLGHSSINTTYEYYTDVIEGNTEILTCLNELYAMDDGEVED